MAQHDIAVIASEREATQLMALEKLALATIRFKKISIN